VQYARWVFAVVRGDLGWSISQQRPALAVVLDALPNSLMLVLPGVLLAVLVGSALGAWQGIHARSMGDRISNTFVFVLYALPEFWIALCLLLLFSVMWPLFPSGGLVRDTYVYMNGADQILDRLWHLALPCLVIALFDAAALARYQRESMRDTLEQPFVRTARAAGLPWTRVYTQAWRASLLPVLTVLGMLVPLNIMGVVFVEQVFSWPGMGLTLFNAITARDYDVVAACVIVGGVVIAIAGIVVDVLREVADPRLRMRDASSAVLPSTRPAA
jgi:peptide/nickel transport system permease protein